MIEPVGLAAGQFALQCVGGWWWGWLKRRRLATAYRASAEETIDCVLEGYPATSAVWNSVTSLLGSVERARQVARWYTQGISSNELQDMDKGDPAVGRFIGDFIVRLNDRRADLLTTDQSNLADVISERVALLVQQATPGTAQKAARISYWVDLPPSLGEKFVGRRSDFDALAGAFETSRAVVISGGAGTGKSRLAAEYARWAGADGFWTAAGANASQTLVALAKSLGVPIQDGSDADTATEVQRRLSELPRETLWVVDNVHDLGLVNELSSAVGLVRLLLTTRDARRNLLPPTVAFRAIAVIDPGAAIDLLCSRPRPESSWDSQDPSLREIADWWDGSPWRWKCWPFALGRHGKHPSAF